MSVVWLKKKQESKKRYIPYPCFIRWNILFSIQDCHLFYYNTNNHQRVFLFLALKHILFIFMWVLWSLFWYKVWNMMDYLPGKRVLGSLTSHSKCEPLFDSSFNKQILTTIKSLLNLWQQSMIQWNDIMCDQKSSCQTVHFSSFKSVKPTV